MTTAPDRSTVTRLLAGLDRQALGRFTADLWTLRGRTARFDGDVIHVDGTRDADRVLLVAHDGGLFNRPSADLPSGVDPTDVVAVVTNADDAGARALAERVDARLVGPSDLQRMALYAIDREDCETLLRRHFDRSLDDIGPVTVSEPLASQAAADSPVLAAVSVGLLALLTVLAASVAGTAVPGLTGFGADESSVDGTARPTTPLTATDTATPPSTPDQSLGCHLTPRGGTDATLSAFAANDAATNESLRRVWDGATVEFRRYAGPFETFVTIMNNYPFVGLLDPTAVEYENATQTGRVARQTVTITSSRGTRNVYTLTFVLEDPDDQECWSLSGLTYRSQDRTANTTSTNEPSPTQTPTPTPISTLAPTPASSSNNDPMPAAL